MLAKTRSTDDQCLYTKFENNKWMYVLLYVDDLIVAHGDGEAISLFSNIISQNFVIKDLGDIGYYLGIQNSSHFKVLHTELDGNNLLSEPKRLWNMDETGCSLSHSPGRVCVRKRSKHLQARMSGNKETVTLLCAGNAAGDVIPPHITVKGKTARSLNSVRTEDLVSDSGWTKHRLAL